MNRDILNKVLDGDQEAITTFGGCDHCVVVDWRDQADDVVSAFAAFLPGKKLLVDEIDEGSYRIYYGERSADSASGLRHEELFLLINSLLAPAFEARQFRPFDGDSYSLYLASTQLWKELEEERPEAVDKYFLSMERLAAYWRKSYWARLFSKP